LAQRVEEDARERAEDLVARLVAEAVVDLLELVEVDEDQTDRAAEALDAADLPFERLLELAPVRKLREAVRHGLPLELAVEARVLESDRRLPAEPVGALTRVVRGV